ncbi:N-acetyltransferase [Rhizocola hellebori]|uniref:N-acetyltransferase n=1 Tax=Rhizocola hellebori TaxID=1392758 RepID=A0A8J3VEW8_9ACTN|nr:GNAT family N-acetyltransferase [Rhizocola hellebori]GIH03686.1 N-acetyltransferase [Rhizocola hellebori]
MYPVEILGPRLVLRDYRIDDAEEFHALLVHPRRVPGPLEIAAPTVDMVVAELTLRQTAAQEPDRKDYQLAMTLDGRIIGSCSLSGFEPRHFRAELGYMVHPDLHGHGYASEAARLMVRFGLGELGLHRIEATTAPDNAASQRVLEKIGMSYEGLARHHVLVGGHTWRDSLRYAILATDPMP